MTKKSTACFNCEYHRDKAIFHRKLIKKMIKSIPNSELKNLLIEMKILKEDYVTKEISLINKNG